MIGYVKERRGECSKGAKGGTMHNVGSTNNALICSLSGSNHERTVGGSCGKEKGGGLRNTKITQFYKTTKVAFT